MERLPGCSTVLTLETGAARFADVRPMNRPLTEDDYVGFSQDD
jgi:hypothetical protein